MNFTQDAPAIVISLTSPTPEAVWHQVLLGIEEEGIPWQWQQDDDTDAILRAWQAATCGWRSMKSAASFVRAVPIPIGW